VRVDSNKERTPREYNLHLVDITKCDDDGMPIIAGTQHVNTSLIPFSAAAKSKDYGCGVHFYIDDYRFERVWNKPEVYIDMLRKFDCVLTPDFSTYTDMPLPVQEFNIYRNLAFGRMMQDSGIEVIPSLSWSDKRSYKFFESYPINSTLAVSTVGCGKKAAHRELFQQGLDEAIKRLEPTTLIVYGKARDFNFHDVNVVFAEHSTMEGLHGRQR
jgi:hypothetical protein